MRSNSAWSGQPTSGAGWFPPPCASESFALHEAANQTQPFIRKDVNEALHFQTADIVHVVDPGYSEVCHVNLECVAYLQEIRRKPTPNDPACGFLAYSVLDGMNLTVTETAFERI